MVWLGTMPWTVVAVEDVPAIAVAAAARRLPATATSLVQIQFR